MRKAETEELWANIFFNITSLSFVFFLPFGLTLITSHIFFISKACKSLFLPKTLYMFSALYQVHVFYLLVIFKFLLIIILLLLALLMANILIWFCFILPANIMTAFKLFINSNNLFNVLIIAIMTAMIWNRNVYIMSISNSTIKWVLSRHILK